MLMLSITFVAKGSTPCDVIVILFAVICTVVYPHP